MRIRTAVKRDEIIATAGEVFRELGFERASMSEIAARLGGSKATLYGYFDSKEALFVAVTQAEANDYFEPILSDLTTTHADVRTALRRLGEQAMQFVLQPHAVAGRRMVIAVALQSNIGKSFYESGPQRGLEFIAMYMKSLMAKGVLRPADAAVMAQHLMALLESELIPECMYGVKTEMPKPARIRDAVKRAIDVFLAAYQKEPRG